MGRLLPSDVPIHRPSVGADATNMGSLMPDNFYENFKPYVYRGTGFDTLTPDLNDYPAKPKPRKRKPKRKSQWMLDKEAARREARYRLGDRRHPEHHIYYKSHPQPLGPEPEPEPKPEPLPERPIRPAPGWKPMTGADIDALLEALDAESS